MTGGLWGLRQLMGGSHERDDLEDFLETVSLRGARSEMEGRCWLIRGMLSADLDERWTENRPMERLSMMTSGLTGKGARWECRKS